MSSAFLPAPIYAQPFITDPSSGQQVFNPVWLDWWHTIDQLLANVGGNSAVSSTNQSSGLTSLITPD
ncbi:MAG: hypothetical protein KGI11_09580, partial [Thaumarchaeota archaeon]|nr:hypothetical protein [Nitrososphaerota archaeon]